MSNLYYTNTLSWIFNVLADCRPVRVQTCSHTRTHCPDSQSDSLCPYSLLLNAVCLAEKQQIPIAQSIVLTRSVVEIAIYGTRAEHGNHYTTDAVPNSSNVVVKFQRTSRKNSKFLNTADTIFTFTPYFYNNLLYLLSKYFNTISITFCHRRCYDYWHFSQTNCPSVSTQLWKICIEYTSLMGLWEGCSEFKFMLKVSACMYMQM